MNNHNFGSHHHDHKIIFNSRLYDKNINSQNNQLYEPLRNTVMHPQYQNQTSHRIAEQHALKSSHVSHQYRHLSDAEYQNIKNQTLITNDHLKKTHHIQKVQNKSYFIMDAMETERQPISEQEMQRRINSSRLEDDVIIYEKESQTETESMKQLEVGVPEKAPKYREKYNLYSMLDQPYERIKSGGCKAFKCPQNQCIASQHKYSWFN